MQSPKTYADCFSDVRFVRHLDIRLPAEVLDTVFAFLDSASRRKAESFLRVPAEPRLLAATPPASVSPGSSRAASVRYAEDMAFAHHEAPAGRRGDNTPKPQRHTAIDMRRRHQRSAAISMRNADRLKRFASWSSNGDHLDHQDGNDAQTQTPANGACDAGEEESSSSLYFVRFYS